MWFVCAPVSEQILVTSVCSWPFESELPPHPTTTVAASTIAPSAIAESLRGCTRRRLPRLADRKSLLVARRQRRRASVAQRLAADRDRRLDRNQVIQDQQLDERERLRPIQLRRDRELAEAPGAQVRREMHPLPDCLLDRHCMLRVH